MSDSDRCRSQDEEEGAALQDSTKSAHERNGPRQGDKTPPGIARGVAVAAADPREAAGAHPGTTADPVPPSPVVPARRRFLQSAMAGAALTAAPLSAQRAHAATPDTPAVAPAPLAPSTTGAPRTVELDINGRRYALQLEPRVTLLDALRDYVGLVGTKKGCDRGQCGACTVLFNGRRINACLTLAIMHEGDTITTVEGLSSAVHGEIMQKAFVEYDAFQCGFCTPGQLCSATAVLTEYGRGDASAVTRHVGEHPPTLTDAEIRERMSGNICRCGAYQNIVGAVRACARAARMQTDTTEQPVVPARATRSGVTS